MDSQIHGRFCRLTSQPAPYWLTNNPNVITSRSSLAPTEQTVTSCFVGVTCFVSEIPAGAKAYTYNVTTFVTVELMLWIAALTSTCDCFDSGAVGEGSGRGARGGDGAGRDGGAAAAALQNGSGLLLSCSVRVRLSRARTFRRGCACE